MVKFAQLSKSKKIICFLLLLISFSTMAIFGQLIKEMSFVDKPIVDILFALAAVGQKTIIPDETVHGNASFYVSNTEFDKALKVFLDTYKLYLVIDGGIYYVSKVRIEYNSDTDKVDIDAEDVIMKMVVDVISKGVHKTILYDNLPTINVTIHQKNIAPVDLLKIVIAPAPGYQLDVFPTHFYIKAQTMTPPPNLPTTPGIPDAGLTKCNGEFYCINKSKMRFKDLIYQLFALEGKEVQVLFPRDILIDELLRFSNKTFLDMLRLILEQANADYYIENGIYYIYEVAERDIKKKLKNTAIIQLKYITAQDLQRLFPADIGSSQFFRIDTNENFVILNGSTEEISPIKDFIDNLDKPLLDSRYYRFDLNFLKATNIFNYLPEAYKFLRIVQLPEANAFVMPLTKEKKEFLDNYIKTIDRPLGSSEIRLKYIKSEDLLKKLPPSVVREDIIDTQDPSMIFFKGTKEKYNAFRKELAIFDQPVPQIRYQILVISYNQGENFDWQPQLNENDKMATLTASTEPSSSITTAIGSLLGINFDIPNLLGWTLASNLSMQLTDNNAQVVTDTMINALSGEKVSFSDQQSQKYLATATSTVNGTTSTTNTTQSIDTGFTLSIDGWASGDEMITMKVEIKLSSSSGNISANSTVLPTTFDKTIQTKSRTKSGEPLKIGGLITDNTQENTEKIPILGDIPILGYIFKRDKNNSSKSEIVIYILPHIVYSKEEMMDTGRRLNKYYLKYFNPNLSADNK
jgi:general secretion pathway protein D